MVITAKSNGDPQRAIDYQPLNKYSQRQTFPVQSPFHLASQIPANVKQSVVDCWNGYHSVPLHPQDRHYTAFLTEWGLYQYKVSAQGHLVSGDGYNERLDAITSAFKDHVRCVDDTVIWATDVPTYFLQVSRFLDICARNGIILNMHKFQFCEDTVLFAGLHVSNSSVMPSMKLLESIRNFPVPTCCADGWRLCLVGSRFLHDAETRYVPIN